MRTPAPIRTVLSWVDRFEQRGVYVPGENNRPISPWRDYGWTIAGWLLAVAMFIVFFAMAA